MYAHFYRRNFVRTSYEVVGVLLNLPIAEHLRIYHGGRCAARNFRDGRVGFGDLRDQKVVERYSLPRELTHMLEDMLHDDLDASTDKGNPIAPNTTVIFLILIKLFIRSLRIKHASNKVGGEMSASQVQLIRLK